MFAFLFGFVWGLVTGRPMPVVRPAEAAATLVTAALAALVLVALVVWLVRAALGAL